MPVPRFIRRLSAVAGLAAVATGGLALPAGAIPTHAGMTVTKSGRITKVESASSFKLTSGSKTYVVTTNDMTHVTVDGKASKPKALKSGETVTVKGSLEMDTLVAATITEGM